LLIFFQWTLWATVFWLLHLPRVAGKLRQQPQAEKQKPEKLPRFSAKLITLQMLLIPNDFVTLPPQLTLPLLLRLRQLGAPSLNLINRGVTDFFAEKIPFLNHKIAAFPNFGAVVSLHCLVEGEAVFSKAALYASS
jgi:hypothetical protein